MVNRSLALVASLVLGAVSFGSVTTSASAQEFQAPRIWSKPGLGSEQFTRGYGGQRVIRQQVEQRYVVVQPQRYLVQPMPRMHHGNNGAALVIGFAAAILGAMAAGN